MNTSAWIEVSYNAKGSFGAGSQRMYSAIREEDLCTFIQERQPILITNIEVIKPAGTAGTVKS